MKKSIYLNFALSLLLLCANNIDAQSVSDQRNTKSIVGQYAEEPRPVLTVTPREINLGAIKPGEKVSGEFLLRNITSSNMEWSVSCPEGWEATTTKRLKGMTNNEPTTLRLEVMIDDNSENIKSDKSSFSMYRASLKMEAAGRETFCRRELKAGAYRKSIKFNSPGGQRTIFLDFRIHALQEMPSINLDPQRLDLGVQMPGKIISRRIELTNRGREILKWSVAPAQSGSPEWSKGSQKERYVSFHNEEVPGAGKYVIPEHLKEYMELIGKWTEKNGYPLSKGSANAMKFRFLGTGISLFIQSHSPDGHCFVYLDDVPLNLTDVLSGEWEKKELLIAEGMQDGQHTVTFVIREGSLELEGVKIFGKDMLRGPRGWITVFPNSGTTMTEKDYVNVKVDTAGLVPGYYGDQIIFKSNAGDEIAEIFVDVVSDSGQKLIDIFLYTRDFDYLFTADPQAESRRLIQNGYIKEGIAFRLFTPQTPGTTSFHRWYNPILKDHYYHYEREGGGKKLDGYVYEGIIGNIATSRMSNTRELYRWRHPSTGRHFYSTNPKGATDVRRGYRFEGIAGYVR